MSPFFLNLFKIAVSAFAEQMFVYAIVDILHPITVSSTDLRSGPTGEADLPERPTHVRPVDITISDFAEAVFLAPVLHVQFDDTPAQLADPLCRFAETLMVPDVEVTPHPRAVDLIKIFNQLIS